MSVHGQRADDEPSTAADAAVLQALDAAVAPFGVRRARRDDLPRLGALAGKLLTSESLTGDIASLEDVARVESWSRRTLYVRERDGDCVGFIALVFLTEAGHAALRSGALDATIAERGWVAELTEPPAAALLWSMGGESGGDRIAVVRALLAIWSETVPAIPGYSRAATKHGLRLMVRLGFEETLTAPGRGALWGRVGAPVAVMKRRDYKRTPQGRADLADAT